MFYIVARELNHRFYAVTILFIIASQVGKLCVYAYRLSLRHLRLLFGQPLHVPELVSQKRGIGIDSIQITAGYLAIVQRAAIRRPKHNSCLDDRP